MTDPSVVPSIYSHQYTHAYIKINLKQSVAYLMLLLVSTDVYAPAHALVHTCTMHTENKMWVYGAPEEASEVSPHLFVYTVCTLGTMN